MKKKSTALSFKWDWCSICGPHIKCPACGNNCCNGTYGMVDDKICDICNLAYQYQDLAEITKKYPKTEKDVEKFNKQFLY